MRSSTALFRDVGIGSAGVVAVITQVAAENWFLASVALVAAVLWILSLRHHRLPDTPVSQLGFAAIAILIAIRVVESRLALSITGMWFLAVSIDLQRLVAYFPIDSSPTVQRGIVSRHLTQLGILGALTAGMVLMARLVRLPLRLSAILLTGVFVVVVVLQSVGKISDPDEHEPAEESPGETGDPPRQS